MREQDDNRRPEEIENDIERTRAEVSSTIDAIQSKLTPGQMMDQAVAYARTSLPADFGANLGNTVRDNPMPVALIGIGIGWLMMQGQNSDGRARQRRRQAAEYEAYESSLYGADSMTATDGGVSREGKVHHMASKAGEKGRDLKDRASEAGSSLMGKASEIGQRISGGASSVAGRARDMTHSARDRMYGAREKVSGSAEGARARASDIGHRSQEQYYQAKDSFSRMFDEQPLMLGALGVAIGTLLGAALPSTRREDRLMGSTRDSFLDTAKEAAREKTSTFKESAQRVAQTAEHEVKAAASEASGRARDGDGRSTAQSTTQSPGASSTTGIDETKPSGQSLH